MGPLGVPPYDAGSSWPMRTLLEAWHDLTPFLVVGLILAAAARRQQGLPPDRRRLRGTVLLLALHLITLPILGALADEPGSAYANLRLVSLACATIVGINISLVLLFDGVLHRLHASPPRIVLDVLTAISFAVAAVVLLSARGVNLSGLLTTSAILTAVIGLSLQDTLGNLMGGLALQLERSVTVGDWIRYGDWTGKVVAIRWRQTTIETRNWETVIIPNSALVKSSIVVLGRRTGEPIQWRRWIHFNVDFRYSPHDVIDTCEAALRKAPIEGVAADPPPNCILFDMSDSYNHFAVRYWLTDLAKDDPTDSVVRNRIFFALRRCDIPLTIPAQAVFVTKESQQRHERKRAEEAEQRRVALRTVDLFDALSEDEISELADGLHYAPFARGETVSKQGAAGHHLYLIVSGRVGVWVSAGGPQKRVASLETGNFFGERSLLTGEPRSATVVAEIDTLCYRLDKREFEALLHKRPELADDVAEVLAHRESQLFEVVDDLTERARAEALADRKSHLVETIRTFFGV